MKLPCPQCGGDIRLEETAGFARCAFCGTSLVLDLAGARPHLVCRPRHGAAEVLPLLRRWGEGRLDTLALVGAPRLTYYPFWRYEVAGRPRLVPAWPSLDPRWSEVAAPDGEQVVFDPAEVGEATLVEPAVEEAAARSRLPEATGAKPGELLHVPFFDAAVRCGALRFPVLVEASSGRVYAGSVPESMPGSRPTGTRLFLGGGLLLMTAEAALLPAWWLTVPTLAVTAAFVYWGLASGEQA